MKVDRTLSVVENEIPFRRRLYQTKENNLKQNHLWISVFSPPPRSRYTRCQRVTACTVCLFLSMFGNAMWFGVISEPSIPGFELFGLVTISLEEIVMAVIINAASFPFVFLIVFLFKYSKPSKLRQNNIDKILKEQHEDSSDLSDIEDSINGDLDDEAKNKEEHEKNDKPGDADTKSLASVGKQTY